jgi:hypothetical protein
MSEVEAVESLITKDDLFDPAILTHFAAAFERGRLSRSTGPIVNGRAAED